MPLLSCSYSVRIVTCRCAPWPSIVPVCNRCLRNLGWVEHKEGHVYLARLRLKLTL